MVGFNECPEVEGVTGIESRIVPRRTGQGYFDFRRKRLEQEGKTVVVVNFHSLSDSFKLEIASLSCRFPSAEILKGEFKSAGIVGSCSNVCVVPSLSICCVVGFMAVNLIPVLIDEPTLPKLDRDSQTDFLYGAKFAAEIK